MASLHTICVWTQVWKIKRKSLMRDSDWLKLKLRLIFLICVRTQILYNDAIVCTHCVCVASSPTVHERTLPSRTSCDTTRRITIACYKWSMKMLSSARCSPHSQRANLKPAAHQCDKIAIRLRLYWSQSVVAVFSAHRLHLDLSLMGWSH